MRTRFHRQLEQLHEELTQMGDVCQAAISAAAQTLLRHDPALAEQARQAERELDRRERQVESLCLELLLRQQPVAGDLRDISAALKLISDLERIGDQAADIAELTCELRLPAAQQIRPLEEMAQAVIRMVADSVDAFVRRDLALARSVYRADDVVDALFSQEKQALVDRIAADAACGEQSLDLLMAAKYLERIGDHATNVAEWAEYAMTGVHPSESGYSASAPPQTSPGSGA